MATTVIAWGQNRSLRRSVEMAANTEKTTAGGRVVSSHNLLIFGFDIVGVIGSSPTNPTAESP